MSRKASFLVGALAAAVLMGSAGAGAQTTSEPVKLPPLPPATQDSGSSTAQPAPAQADTQQQPTAADQASSTPQATVTPASGSASSLPPLPLDHDGIGEVQGQLIALGFDPGAADGETGPATMAAVQKYNESRGGNGPVPVDGRLLARLQQDDGPRLTPEQVAVRARPRYAVPANPDPLGGVVQQFQSNIRALLNGGY